MKQTICPNCGGSLKSVAIGWRCKKCKGFISLQDGKFFEYVEKPFMPPMTNADRIRAMSDEELAKEFADCAIGLYCDTRKKGIPELPESVKREVFDSLLEWLKQPAEE